MYLGVWGFSYFPLSLLLLCRLLPNQASGNVNIVLDTRYILVRGPESGAPLRMGKVKVDADLIAKICTWCYE